MSNLGFQTIYRLFNDQPDIVCERVFLPPKQELAALLESGARIVTLESQTPVERVRRPRLLGVVRVGLHQRPDDAAAGRPAAARRGSRLPASARRDRRRGDVRQPRAAGAVCRRDRRRRRRSRWCRRWSTACGTLVAQRARCGAWRRQRGFYIPSFYDVEYAADGTIARYVPRDGTGAPPVVRKAALKTTDACDPPSTSIFTPDTEFGSRFLDRGRARLRQPVPLLLGRLQLPAGPRVSDRAHPRAGAGGARRTRRAPAWCPSRSAITPTSSTSCAASRTWAIRSARRRCGSTT